MVPLGCTPAHSPQSCGSGERVGSWGQMGGHMWIHTSGHACTQAWTQARMDTHRSQQHPCTHQHTRSDKHMGVDTHLSSDAPSAGSALPGLQAGGWTGLGPERGSVLTCPILALCLSLASVPSCSSQPCHPPSPLPVKDRGHSQSRVAGRAETSFPRCRLVRVVECFRELPGGRERKGSGASS